MATGYSAFIEDSRNDIISTDRILGLSVSIEDDYYESDADKYKQSQGCLYKQSQGCLYALKEQGTACFNTDDVRDYGGCPAFFKRGMTPRTRNVQQKEAMLLALTNGENVQIQDVQKKQSPTFSLARTKTTASNTLAAGRKWVSGKTKTAFYSVYGKLLKDDEDPATSSNEKSDATSSNEKSDPAKQDVSAMARMKQELNNARLLLFFMDKDTTQVKKEEKEKGHDSDDGTVDTEKGSSC